MMTHNTHLIHHSPAPTWEEVITGDCVHVLWDDVLQSSHHGILHKTHQHLPQSGNYRPKNVYFKLHRIFHKGYQPVSQEARLYSARSRHHLIKMKHEPTTRTFPPRPWRWVTGRMCHSAPDNQLLPGSLILYQIYGQGLHTRIRDQVHGESLWLIET